MKFDMADITAVDLDDLCAPCRTAIRTAALTNAPKVVVCTNCAGQIHTAENRSR